MVKKHSCVESDATSISWVSLHLSIRPRSDQMPDDQLDYEELLKFIEGKKQTVFVVKREKHFSYLIRTGTLSAEKSSRLCANCCSLALRG